jgi:general stress protein 26
MTPELERAVKRYNQWFGSHKKSGQLVKVQVWLTVNNGCIDFLTTDDSYKVKRIRRDPRVTFYIGDHCCPN